MKKRSSVKKAEWSDEREDYYKSEALEIACKKGFNLIQRDLKVYIIDDGQETPFCEPDKTNRVWFQTWRKLKYPDEQ